MNNQNSLTACTDLYDLNDCSEIRQLIASRPPVLMHATFVVLAVLLLSALAWSYLTAVDLVVVASGKIRPEGEAQQVFMPPETELNGRVSEVLVTQGQSVEAGQLLLRLDTSALDSKIAGAKARLSADEQALKELHNQVDVTKKKHAAARAKAELQLSSAQAELANDKAARRLKISELESELSLATTTWERLAHLVKQQIVSPQEVESAEREMQVLEANLERAKLPINSGIVDTSQAQMELVDREAERELTELNQRIAAQVGRLEQARTELAGLQQTKQLAEIRAPAAGIVLSENVKAGDVRLPGQPILELAAQQDLCFETEVPAAEIGALEIGQKVKLKFDAFDFQRYGIATGCVAFIAPDSRIGGENEDVYRVRVQLDSNMIGRGNLKGDIKLGLTGTAEIVTRNESLLTVLATQIRHTISLN